MKIKYPGGWASAAWKNNKPFVLLLFSLLAILSVLKIIFYHYNYPFIFNNPDEAISWAGKITMVKWSLFYDLLLLLSINLPFLLLSQLARLISDKISVYLLLPIFVLLNSAVILLNLSDIFYFRFHFQRANADLIYVLKHPMEQMLHLNFFIILAFLLAITVVLFAMVKLFRNFQRSFSAGNRCNIITALLLPVILLLPFYKNGLTKLLVPAYPLVELNSRQLLIVQNSFHTFAYSLFRGGQEVNIREYMPVAECDSIFPIRKTLRPAVTNGTGRNIVLFIMESVPYEFFDTGSAYKVAMPFFDSLLQKSSFFKNAFCYTHQSNKGITAILAGIPTLSDIPLYHSSYINMPVTAIGTALMKKNYHSFFCIGDDFDNFGFAKCVHWLGIEDYYSRENIPDNKKLPAHSMGLHDQYVLDFMLGQINRLTPPFLAVNFNISTHYPYDLPATYNTSFPANYTKPMKSMSYYDHCLQKFFRAAETEPWFKQTVFIFCSDHWLVPDDNKFKFNSVDGFRIPIILYDPSRNEKKINTQPVSQFDIPGTILSLAGFKDSIISYGGNLLDSSSINKVVFSRSNASLYQVIDSAYILGFNINSDKTEFLYHYTTDPGLKINLLPDRNFLAILSELTQKIKAFIQKATMQYNRVPFK